MKILYAIQGTGNGHVTRAIELIPYFAEYGKVDILISGIQSDLELPFEITYRFNGMSFIFGKKGGVDIWKTYQKLNSRKLLREIQSLDVSQYDLIISDFEPVSCWAALRAKKPCIGLSNQVATLHPLAPKPKKMDLMGKLVLENYAPTTYHYGFHFKALDHNIFTPIIRQEVRDIKVSNKGHYTVYLPSYDDERILKHLKKFPEVTWHVFSKHSLKKYRSKKILVFPIQSKLFLKSMASSCGVLCNAGFGTTSEALFLKKKLMVIPMKTQLEQQCNAAMLKSMGVSTMKKLNSDYLDKLQNWLNDDSIVTVDYPNQTADIVKTIVQHHGGKEKIDTHFESTHYTIFQ